MSVNEMKKLDDLKRYSAGIGDYVHYDDAKDLVTELANKLKYALDCLDDCHGMEMYWDKYPSEEED